MQRQHAGDLGDERVAPRRHLAMMDDPRRASAPRSPAPRRTPPCRGRCRRAARGAAARSRRDHKTLHAAPQILDARTMQLGRCAAPAPVEHADAARARWCARPSSASPCARRRWRAAHRPAPPSPLAAASDMVSMWRSTSAATSALASTGNIDLRASQCSRRPARRCGDRCWRGRSPPPTRTREPPPPGSRRPCPCCAAAWAFFAGPFAYMRRHWPASPCQIHVANASSKRERLLAIISTCMLLRGSIVTSPRARAGASRARPSSATCSSSTITAWPLQLRVQREVRRPRAPCHIEAQSPSYAVRRRRRWRTRCSWRTPTPSSRAAASVEIARPMLGDGLLHERARAAPGSSASSCRPRSSHRRIGTCAATCGRADRARRLVGLQRQRHVVEAVAHEMMRCSTLRHRRQDPLRRRGLRADQTSVGAAACGNRRQPLCLGAGDAAAAAALAADAAQPRDQARHRHARPHHLRASSPRALARPSTSARRAAVDAGGCCATANRTGDGMSESSDPARVAGQRRRRCTCVAATKR